MSKIHPGPCTFRSIWVAWSIALLLVFTGQSASAQEFRFLPDAFHKINYAKDIPISPYPPGGSANSYNDPLAFTAHDLWANMQSDVNWNTKYSFKSITNLIKVGINHDTAVITANYKYRITLEVTGYVNPVTPTTGETKQVSFILEYNKDSLQTYKDQTVYKIDAGYHAMNVKITGIYDLNAGPSTQVNRTDLARNFFIETSIVVQRYDKEAQLFFINSGREDDYSPLNVTWRHYKPSLVGLSCGFYAPFTDYYKPVKYELEWIYIDDYNYNLTTQTKSYRFNPSSYSIPYSFKNNATRIQTNESVFSIPVVYEHGVIVFRVRTIRPDPANYRKMIYSEWSLPDHGTLSNSSFGIGGALTPYQCESQCLHFISTSFADDKFNWQYSINFAEEGKYKHVLNYFDGAGHGRQTQTKINTDADYIIVADKIYDYEGRPAIQTLPVPVLSSDLSYKPDLSLKQSGSLSPYRASDFDYGCGTDSIAPFASTSLAGTYYSEANPDKSGMQQFVPDAKGYPFMETIYAADNTNKVIWQGGAGLDFQRFKDHGTRNTYVRADQYELNRLMGTESGRFEYYPKQIVTDPNKQSSYTIFNPDGKVVATALMGSAPSETVSPIVPLENIAQPQTVTMDLLANMTQQVGDGLRLAQHSFFPEAGGLNKFLYKGTIQPYVPGCASEYINVQGYYNVKVVDECGNIKKEQNGIAGISNITSSSSGQNFVGSEQSFTLPAEKHTLVKEIYFADTTIYRLAGAFTDRHTGIQDCYVYEDSFIRKTVDAAVFPCPAADTGNPCDILKRRMMDELYPGAKYGNYVKGPDSLFASGAANSIFTSIQVTAPQPPTYTCGPCYIVWPPVQPGTPPPYNGEDRVYECSCGELHHCVFTTGNGWSCTGVGTHLGEELPGTPGTYKYRYQWDCLNLPEISWPHPTNPNLYIAGPAGAAPPGILIAKFNEAIAEALLPLHPEYCKLLLCNDDLEKKLGYIDSYDEAQALGVNDLPGILTSDPLSALHVPAGPLTANQLSFYAIDGTITGASSTLLRRLDTFSLEQAYCGCDGVEAYSYCQNKEYASQINQLQFIDGEVKDLYIKKLIGNYLGNRNLLKQKLYDGTSSCGPCAALRMTVIPEPVFPEIFNGASSNMSYDPSMPSWAWDIFQQGFNGPQFSGVPAKVKQQFDSLKEDQCKAQVKVIMNALANCGLSATDSTNLSLSLIAAGCVAGSGGNLITPEMVKSKMISAGISLSDLCSPFLAAYSLYDGAQQKAPGSYVNKKASFYSGLQQFLNRTEILTALHDAGSSTPQTLTIGTANTFEAELGQLLNLPSGGSITARAYLSTIAGITATSQQYIRLLLANGSYKDTLYFSTRKLNTVNYCANPLLLQPAPMDGAVSNLVFDNLHSVLNDPLSSSQEGYIADNLVFADFRILVPGGASTVYACSPYNIWSHSIPMLKKRDPEGVEECIHCVQIKNEVNQYFADASAYGLPVYANHPLFEDALSNYLNYRLQRNHTFEEYERLMQGCALSDQIRFPRVRSTYEVRFAGGSGTGVVNANNFVTSIATAFPDFNINYLFINRSSLSVPEGMLWVDLNSVPKSKLRAVKNYIDAYPASYKNYLLNNPIVTTADIFIKSGSCAPPFSSMGMTLMHTEAVGLRNMDGSYSPHTWYEMQAVNGTPAGIAGTLQDLKDYLDNATNNCVKGYTELASTLYRSSDYSSSVKQAYLSYVYGLGTSGVPDDEINDRIAPVSLVGSGQVPPQVISANQLSYRDPWCSNVREDLYYAILPTSANAGWNKLTVITDRVKLALGNSALFPAANVTTVAPGTLGTGGTSLKAYKMSNGWAWYRLFDQQNKLYNVYLIPSNRMVGAPSSYQMVPGSIEPIFGADSIYRFKVRLQKTLSGGTHYVTCEGYTNFALAPAKKLQHVVLNNHRNNQGCLDTFTCEREVLAGAILQGKILHGLYIDSIKQRHYLAMREHFPANTKDSLLFTTLKQQYQYTLYYYDLAGNLTRTVPPSGVDTLAPASIAQVDASRNVGGTNLLPVHHKVSTYKYNSFNQLIWQQTPDAGITEFFYDAAGRLCFSQNAKQKPLRKYSYTLYDDQGRIIEAGAIGFAVGEVPIGGSHPLLVRESGITNMNTIRDQVTSKPREDVVATFYDSQLLLLGSNPGMSPQENLRKRVSSILFAPFLSLTQTPESFYTYGSHFSYDALGNVSTLVQDNPYLDYMDQRFKRIDYDYDLLSGKVNMVSYNRGKADQFYHQYTYDADNRITKVQSSNDGLIWDRDAAYTYYKHGPLARAEIGELNVQSLQYAYTIQGWLKAINGDILRSEDDMGKDGLNGGPYPADVFAHALDYHQGDYKPIGTTRVTYTDSTSPLTRSLYNGNIARQTTGIHSIDNLQRTYQYDQLNRLKTADYARVNNDLTRAVTTMANAYRNTYRYDADGNIKTLTRRSEAGAYIDTLSYFYNNLYANNKLSYVADAAPNSGGTDLPTGQATDNYQYDNIGNLVKDVQGHIDNITWNLYGKVNDMEMTGNNVHIHYDYDGTGNRVRKDVFAVENGDTLRHSDIYVRDASGNIMAVYKGTSKINGGLTIEWANSSINDYHGAWETPSGTGITPFLSAEYGGNGQFTATLIHSGITSNIGWANSQSASVSLYDYLVASDGIYSQALHEPLKDYFRPLTNYSVSVMKTTWGSEQNQVFLPLLTALVESPDTTKSKATLLHMATYAGTIASYVVTELGIQGVKNNPTAKANALYGYVQSNGSAALVDAYYDKALSNSVSVFYEKLAQDSNIVTSTWLSRYPDLTAYLSDKIGKYAGRVTVATFFKNWLPTLSANWLDNHSALDERLGVVYSINKNAFLNSYLDNIGIASVNNALHTIPQLTVNSYINSIQQAVLTGTLNPGYTPPDVNTPSPENLAADTLYLAEHHLYGSSRLGIKTYDRDLYKNIYGEVPTGVGGGGTGPNPVWGVADSSLSRKRPWFSYGFADWIKKDKADEYTGSVYNLSLDTLREVRHLGRKQYEMTDHLGNVLATVLDRRSGYGSLNSNYIGYLANLASVSDVYPFGMPMQGRSKAYADYGFGFNGQMKTDEVYGKGNLNTALFWEYDTRLGRRWNVDPEGNESESPYSVFGDNPIINVDVDGDSWTDIIAGAVIGTVTNVIPFTGQIRDMYTPDDSKEYNNTLRSSDNTFLVVGVGSIATGAGIAATGGTVSLSGVGAVVGVPTAATGGAVALSGAVVTLNAISNQSQGYNRGKKKQSTEGNGDEYKNTKHVDNRHIDRNKYPDKSKYKKPNQVEKLQKRTIKSPDQVTKQKGNRVRYDKDFKRSIGTKGETSHRVIVDEKKKKIVTSFPQKAD